MTRAVLETRHFPYPLMKLSAVTAAATNQTALETAVTTVPKQTVKATAVINVQTSAARITAPETAVKTVPKTVMTGTVQIIPK
jgi:hypothetical protein